MKNHVLNVKMKDILYLLKIINFCVVEFWGNNNKMNKKNKFKIVNFCNETIRYVRFSKSPYMNALSLPRFPLI